MENRYRLLKGLASGGMADVWIGLQTSGSGFSKVCAVKTIKNIGSVDQELVTMFRDEAKICQTLQHANVVQVLDFADLGDAHALIMEFVQGVNLFHIMKKLRDKQTAFPVSAVLFVGQEVCKGLYYVHSRKDPLTDENLGIVHRDISPSNILLSVEGEVKITDFGIAKAKVNSHSTQIGVIKGKYQYMSPEQFRGEKADHRTDIYALGCVLWECFANRKIYEAQSDAHLIQMIVESAPRPPLSELNPHIDQKICDIIDKAMAFEPNARYQSAGEFASEIQQYLAQRQWRFSGLEMADFLRLNMPEELANAQGLVKFAMAQASTPEPPQESAFPPREPQTRPEFTPPPDIVDFGNAPTMKTPWPPGETSRLQGSKPKAPDLASKSLELDESPGVELRLSGKPAIARPSGAAQALRTPTSGQPQSLNWSQHQGAHSQARLRRRRASIDFVGWIFAGILSLCIAGAVGVVGIAVAQYGYGVDVIGEISKFSAKLKE